MVDIKSIFIDIIIGAIIIILLVLILVIIGINKMNDAVTYIQCCDGNVCSDTYYTSKDNLCHLSLCENSLFTTKSDCVYEGKNISINMTLAQE